MVVFYLSMESLALFSLRDFRYLEKESNAAISSLSHRKLVGIHICIIVMFAMSLLLC